MSNPTDWPLPSSLGIDEVLYELIEHAGLYLNDDGFDAVVAELPHLLLAWLSAAGRYASADYQLQLLDRPIAWMRDEISPSSGQGTDEIILEVNNLRRLLNDHTEQAAALATATRDFTAACVPLTRQGLLLPNLRQWRETLLIAHGLTTPATVRVPSGAAAPWPLVKASPSLIEQLAPSRPDRAPEPGFPVVRRALAGYARLDHGGTWQRLLPDLDGWYWLRDFAWTAPPIPGPAPDQPTAPA